MYGLFITFEGPDGAGKTTQITLLAQALGRRGLPVRLTREPGGTAAGEAVRKILLDPAHCLTPEAEALLYMAARAQHVAEVIRPALSRGEIVLSDRYSDSTLIYQGAARRLDRAALMAINQFATGSLVPDLTVVLDCPPEVLRERRRRRGVDDRLENESEAFHAMVRRGFLDLAEKEPGRVRLVRGDGSPDLVHAAVLQVIDEFFAECMRSHGGGGQHEDQ